MNFSKQRKKSRLRKHSTNMMVDYMNGKWRGRNKAVRNSAEMMVSDDEDDEPQSSGQITNWAEEFFGKRTSSVVDYDFDQDVEIQLTRKQTLILSTLVPDQILLMEKRSVGEPKRFVGVLLMADVSGFTALSERYNNTGKGGTYRLTVTLNTYLGALIELIYTHGGDIIKFAGDAFLACWKTDKKTFLCHTIHSVIVCALVIQHSYAKYETDVKVNLRVKLAISAGNLMFSTIGAETDMNYVLIGLPVIEAKLAETLCASGEVKLTPSAWAHCYSRNYDHVVHEDGHVTIKSILYDPNDQDVSRPYLGFTTLLRQAKKPYTAIERLPNNFCGANNISAGDLEKIKDTFSLRKAILTAGERNIGSQIRNFMIRPVLTQIDAHQPLEYLTEMRQVSVVFVTLKPRECPPLQLITIVNNSYQITCQMVYKSMGCVNKIILFDKDVMILVIFGLRGFKHDSEAQAALKCAHGIKRSVSALDGVLEVSIGVTTGQVYCGVVGHPLRREFTVIGAIVNKAARLMCYFRNKITCDEETFIQSKMSNNGFTLQPPIELKGIHKAGKIYEYAEEIRAKEMNNIPMIPPILNRVDEIDYFESWLDQANSPYRDFDGLLLIGESRFGKTRMMEWLARLSSNRGHKVINMSLTSIHSANPYLALSQIINQILGLTEPLTGFVKEQRIVELLKVYCDDLCYLNNIVKVRFAYPDGVSSLDEDIKRVKAQNMFKKLFNYISDTYVIFLDDLQNLDAHSWEYISIMLTCKKIFMVLSVTRGKFSAVHSWLYDVFINNDIRKIVLSPLESCWMPALACQILDVDAVPDDLCEVIKTNCKGMPGVVDSFLLHLFSNGAIELINVTEEDLQNYANKNLIFPDETLLKPQAVDVNKQELLDQFLNNSSTAEKSICIVTDKDALNISMKDQSIDTLIMVQIDSLTPYQQLLLKIASVIGNTFSRDLLENIMYENNALTTAKAVKRLFAMRILSCANSKLKWVRLKGLSTASSSAPFVLECDCDIEYDSANSSDLPKYAFCQVMRFRNKNARQTCYELLPMNQKKEFHTRVFNYLENNKQKCPSCGGYKILQSVSFQLDDNVTLIDNESSCSSDSSPDVGDLRSQRDSIVRSKSSSKLFTYAVDVENTRGASSDSDKRKSEDDDRRPTKRVTISSLVSWKHQKWSKEENNIFGMVRQILEAEHPNDWHQLGVIDSKDDLEQFKDTSKHFTINIEKGISTTDFNKCTCAELDILFYEQLVHHALQAEVKSKAVEYLVQYCSLSLMGYKEDTVEQKLEEALAICRENAFPEPDLKRYLGRIYSLKSSYRLLNNDLEAAKLEIEKAAKIYGLKSSLGSNMKNIKSVFKFKRNINEATAIDSVFCLNIATTLYNLLGDPKTAINCAYNAIKIIQRLNCRVVDICHAFSNALQLEVDRGFPEVTVEVERIIKHTFRHLPQPVKADELYALGKMFQACFRARAARAQLPSAVRCGLRALVVTNLLHAYEDSLNIIPDLFYIMLARCRIEEAVDVLMLSLRMSNNRESYVSETWYYALCLDLILDAGLQLESAEEVHRYAEFALQRRVEEGAAARRRLVVNLWTYWLRLDVERRAKKYESEALHWLDRDDDDYSLTSILSSLRLAEGLLESLARKMDDLRKVVDLLELRSIADRELSYLEKDCRLVRTLYCRWIRLKACSLSLSGRQAASTTMFNQALEEGKRIDNVLEMELARASLYHSKYWIEHARRGNTVHWRSGSSQARRDWHQMLYKITTYRR